MGAFNENIYQWYNVNKRDLPWRETRDAYKIWLSEVILQQTRVDQGMAYYLRFTERFPTVESLALAHEDEVLKLWQGLGYYSRARNLHQAAKTVHFELKGHFPDTHQGLLNLKGVGNYTAAAVASIAYDLPFPAVDGNVNRVLARYFGIETPVDSKEGRKKIEELALWLMPQTNSGMHNQALMEFGALQCVPVSPDCEACPLHDSCVAFASRKVNQLPVKTTKTKQRKRYFYYYYIESGNYMFLEKRTHNDIWQNLYQFPLVEATGLLSDSELLENNLLALSDKCRLNITAISAPKKHVLSHQVIYSRLVRAELIHDGCISGQYIRVNKKDISNFAVPRLIEQYLEENL